MIDIHLHPGREKRLLRGHPWVFGGAVRDLDPATPPGSVVRIRSAGGEVLGVGYANPRCTIAVRVCSRVERDLDVDFFADRLRAAMALRAPLAAAGTDVYRLINGEGDFLPGFVVDYFAGVLVVQCLTAGADALRMKMLTGLLACAGDVTAILDSSRGAVRRAEGLDDREEAVMGAIPARMVLRERGVAVVVTPGRGQKTGYFCDQRDNRARLRELAAGRDVLDAFCYSGGFAVNAALGGARRVVAVDSSRDALALMAENVRENGVAPARVEARRAKVAEYLRAGDDAFDIVVLDPPPLARRRSEVAGAGRAYRDLNSRAMRRLRPGGTLFTFTCSQHVDADTFRHLVSEAAAAAGRSAQILDSLGPGIDHPVALGHPEGEYLRGLLLRVF
jgi:23S rRNA (cytosine1962-C5)-methyltransferase